MRTKLLDLITKSKVTNLIAPIAVGVRNSMLMSFECGSGAAGGPWTGGDWPKDCDCTSNCECYECYDKS